jgi:hypothetical protein
VLVISTLGLFLVLFCAVLYFRKTSLVTSKRKTRTGKCEEGTSETRANVSGEGRGKIGEESTVFISWRMAECKVEVKLLGAALRDAGVKVIVIGELPGGDLLEAVTKGMDAADLFIIMGTETYGMKTSGIIDTYQEMQYIVSSNKPYFLFNMNPELSRMRFQEGAANMIFNLNTVSWERWEVGAPIPEKAVKKILEKNAAVPTTAISNGNNMSTVV